MRALLVVLAILASLPLASANHPGCSPDPSVDLFVAGVECEYGPHHDGTMYEKRVWVGLDEDAPLHHRFTIEHKYSTAAHASTCRITIDSVIYTTIGPPCAGAHSELLP